MVKIATIEVLTVLYPMQGRFKFFEGARGAPTGRPAVLVKITSEDGIVGWGQSVPVPRWSDETLESVAGTLERYLAPALIGRDALDLSAAHEIMNETVAGSFSTGMPVAKAGIDIALHDLSAKTTNQTLAQSWGRPSGGTVQLSWTLNPRRIEDLDASIEEGRERGYRHFNVKVAPDPQFDVELCRRVKESVPEGFLWADANGGYDLETALEVAPKLADAGVDILEQPLKPNRLSGYRELKRQGALPIIMDEGVVSPVELVEFIRLEMLDGVAMKPARCGGLFSARRQIEILRDAGLLFLASGLTDPDVSLAASLVLYGAYEYRLPAALNGPQFLSASVLKSPLVPVDGQLSVPVKPGLGVEVDEAAIAELRVDLQPS